MASPKRVLTVLLVVLVVLACAAGEAEEKKPPKASFLEVGKVRLYRREGRIEVDGRIAVQRRAIELFACCEGGKVHETVVVLDCKPSNLNLALLLLGLSDGGQVREKVQVREKDKMVEKEMLVENGPRFFGDPRKPVGDRLIISVRWKELESGKPREVRAEEMIFNVSRQKTMRKVGWVFTGSRWVEHPKTKKKEFAADHTKTIMTTYHDPNTVLENPLETGGNDETYHANSLVVPPRGTALTLILRVPTAKERLEAEQTEAVADREGRDKKGEKEAGGGAGR